MSLAENHYASEKSTGFRGSKLTTPRIELEEKIPGTSIAENHSALEKAAEPSKKSGIKSF